MASQLVRLVRGLPGLIRPRCAGLEVWEGPWLRLVVGCWWL